MNAFMASLLSGLFVSVAMAPLDLVSTRFYNQGVDAQGKGTYKLIVYEKMYTNYAKFKLV